jgi:hypothetical protein
VIPPWKGRFEGYAVRFAAANHWRVSLVLSDLDDCVQECAEVFCRLCKLYGAVNDTRHLMALYKGMLVNRFNDHARANKRRRRMLEHAQHEADFAPVSEEPAHLYVALRGASRELQMVLRKICDGKSDLRDLMLPSPQSRFSAATERRISRSWCRLARVGTVREDLVTELRGLL